MKRLSLNLTLLFILAICCVITWRNPVSIHAQTATTGLPSPMLNGNGPPSTGSPIAYTCDSSLNNVQYFQADGTAGNRLWTCRSGVWSIGSPLISGTTVSIGGSVLILGGTTSGTATVTGAAVGSVCDANPSDGTLPPVGVQVDCAVTATNTVTVRLQALVAGTPAAKTYNVRVIS